MKEFRVVSLFSGAGGLDLGFLQAGFRIVFANEISESAALTYAENFKLKPIKSYDVIEASQDTIAVCDVALVDFSSLSSLGIDIIIGGPPCQDFSIIGGPELNKKGIRVKRGRLYAHFVKSLVILQPKMFIFENVPGLMKANNGLAYKVILEDFENLNLRWTYVKKDARINKLNEHSVAGYHLLFSEIVDLSIFGVPQRRERLFIIGVRKDLIKTPSQMQELRLLIEKNLFNSRQLFKKYPMTVIEVFEGKPLNELQREYEEVMKKWDGVWKEVNTPKSIRWKEAIWDKMTLNIVEDYVFMNKIESFSKEEFEEAVDEHRKVLKELGYLGRKVCENSLSDILCEPRHVKSIVIKRMKYIPPDENHEFVENTKWRVKGKKFSLIYRRLHPLKPSYTVIARGGGGTYGYHYDRSRAVLSLREIARLQTFPDNFSFVGTKKEIRAQIGEAVPPLASRRIAEVLKEVLLNILEYKK